MVDYFKLTNATLPQRVLYYCTVEKLFYSDSELCVTCL